MHKGMFIAIDGIDGCGSTTHTTILGDYLQEMGKKVHLTREPSSTGVGKLLREYLRKIDIPSPTDALLFAADRVEHYYNEILPKLREGFIVISDRYLESSIAYQAAQGSQNAKKEANNDEPIVKFDIDIKWIENINKFIPHPDLTIILDIDPKIALTRKYSPEEEKDKFENIEFLDEVRKIYLERGKTLKFNIIDVNRDKNLVANEIQMIISNCIEKDQN